MNALAGLAAAAAALSGMLAVALERTPRAIQALGDAMPAEARPSGIRSRISRYARPLPAVSAGFVGLMFAGGFGLLVGVVAGLAIPGLLARRRRLKDERLVGEQLPDALVAIASALRAGMSLSRAIGFAADGAEPPLGPRLREVGAREAMGVPLTESLRLWCTSLPDAESRLLATVLDLHQRAGGGFATVLERVARTLQARQAVEREVGSLTAQGRLSGTILGVLPFAFLGFLFMTSPEDIATAFSTPMGLTALTVGLVMQGLAFLWIRSLLRVAP